MLEYKDTVTGVQKRLLVHALGFELTLKESSMDKSIFGVPNYTMSNHRWINNLNDNMKSH